MQTPLWGIIGSWILSVAFSAALLAAEKPSAIPTDEAIARASKLVKQIFRDDYAALRTAAQRAALGARLYREAVETQDDPAARYVLLIEARDLAARGGDAAIASKAVEQLAQHYTIAPGEMAITALSTAQRTSTSPQAHEAVARCAMNWADLLIKADEYDLAQRLATLAESSAAGAQKVSLTLAVQERTKEIAWAASEYQQAKGLLNAANLDSATPAMRSAAGRFRCLIKGDFEAGLPLLLEGADKPWRDLAEKDSAALSGDAPTQAQVGNLWWDMGDKLPSRARTHCRARAAWWYTKALANLSGLTKTTIQKRLEEVEFARLRELRLEPGLSAQFFATETFEKPVASRIDEQIDFEWSASPCDGVPKDNCSVRWTGRIRITAAGKYTFNAIANEGVRVFIDDQLIIDLPEGSRKRSGKKTTLALNEGLHDFKIEFWDGSGLARVRVLWSPPGTPAEVVIPPSALFHDLTPQR